LFSRDCTLGQNETIVHKNDHIAHILGKLAEPGGSHEPKLQELTQFGKRKSHRPKSDDGQRRERIEKKRPSEKGFQASRW
jgi:hypothetical protein